MTNPNQSDEDHPIIHWTWADDDNESLCGLDLTNHKWYPDTVPVNCVDCIRIDEICTLDEAFYSED